MGSDPQPGAGQPGSWSLWVPRLPDSIPAQAELRELMGIIQCEENRPSRWTCAQEEFSVPETSKEGPVGWTPEGPVLAPLTALGLPSSHLCPHQWSVFGLPTVPGPGAAPPGDSVTQAPLSGDGRPSWDPSLSEMEQLQKLGLPLPRCSGSSPTFPRCLGRLRCLQGPDPGVPTDQGPCDEELLSFSCEFMLGLPPPQGDS